MLPDFILINLTMGVGKMEMGNNIQIQFPLFNRSEGYSSGRTTAHSTAQDGAPCLTPPYSLQSDKILNLHRQFLPDIPLVPTLSLKPLLHAQVYFVGGSTFVQFAFISHSFSFELPHSLKSEIKRKCSSTFNSYTQSAH